MEGGLKGSSSQKDGGVCAKEKEDFKIEIDGCDDDFLRRDGV